MKKAIKKKSIKAKEPKQKAEKEKKPRKKKEKEPVKNGEDLTKSVNKMVEFNLFLDWCATPSVIREPKTQTEFSAQYKVDQDTLTNWKKKDGFLDEVNRRIKIWAGDQTGDILLSLKRNCLQGGKGADVSVWLKMVGMLNDKTEISLDKELKETLEKISGLLPD